jgi:hypothetical protein
MAYLGGDGEWVVMTKCTATAHARGSWAYRLFNDQLDAEAWLAHINRHGCNGDSAAQHCDGHASHKLWRLIDTRASARPTPPRNTITHTMALPSDCEPKEVNWFE